MTISLKFFLFMNVCAWTNIVSNHCHHALLRHFLRLAKGLPLYLQSSAHIIMSICVRRSVAKHMHIHAAINALIKSSAVLAVNDVKKHYASTSWVGLLRARCPRQTWFRLNCHTRIVTRIGDRHINETMQATKNHMHIASKQLFFVFLSVTQWIDWSIAITSEAKYSNIPMM